MDKITVVFSRADIMELCRSAIAAYTPVVNGRNISGTWSVRWHHDNDKVLAEFLPDTEAEARS
jgi:hypothetical protein